MIKRTEIINDTYVNIYHKKIMISDKTTKKKFKKNCSYFSCNHPEGINALTPVV